VFEAPPGIGRCGFLLAAFFSRLSSRGFLLAASFVRTLLASNLPPLAAPVAAHFAISLTTSSVRAGVITVSVIVRTMANLRLSPR
jgi:membrane protease YdiL (CAAX protease family)